MSTKLTFDNLEELFAEVTAELAQKEMKKFEKQLDETVNSLVKEAVKHFTKRFRKSDEDDFDERYLYSETEVNLFKKLNKNPNVKIRTEYDEKNPKKVFCYILYR